MVLRALPRRTDAGGTPDAARGRAGFLRRRAAVRLPCHEPGVAVRRRIDGAIWRLSAFRDAQTPAIRREATNGNVTPVRAALAGVCFARFRSAEAQLPATAARRARRRCC